MDSIDNDSVHLTVTSPPYFVGKDYENYLKSIDDYFDMIRGVFKETVRVTIPGGKIIINLGDLAVGSHFNEGGFPEEYLIMLELWRYLRTLDTYLHGRIIWEKDDPWANSSHVTFHDKIKHGSYRILPAWEYVFVFRKGKKDREDKIAEDGRWITKDEWKTWVHGVWFIRSVQRNDFHEAMFPDELVYRCVKMYSFPGDVVLDPFMGSGTVAVVAKIMGRNFVGYERISEYVTMAQSKADAITPEMIQKQTRYFDKTENKNELQGDIFNVPV
jgi:site-specific DNA-methyltransferase (adenine-specific)